jgi:hypothetical protein
MYQLLFPSPSQRRSPPSCNNFTSFTPTLHGDDGIAPPLPASRRLSPSNDGIAPSSQRNGIAPSLPAPAASRHRRLVTTSHPSSPHGSITPPPVTHGSVAPPPSSRGGITPRLLLAASHRARLLAASHRQRPSPPSGITPRPAASGIAPPTASFLRPRPPPRLKPAEPPPPPRILRL